MKFIQWLVTSSADPSKLALTVKGFLGTLASILLLISPIMHLHISNDQVTAAIDLTMQMLVVFAGVVSGLATLFGFARKVYFTFWK